MLYVKYAYQPFDYYDLDHGKADSFKVCPTAVIKTISLTAEEYDKLIHYFYGFQNLCTDEGGIKNGVFQSIKITAPGQRTLYVNPNGACNPEYIGVEVQNDE